MQLTRDEVLQGFIDGILVYDPSQITQVFCYDQPCETCPFLETITAKCLISTNAGIIANRYIPSLKITHPELFI